MKNKRTLVAVLSVLLILVGCVVFGKDIKGNAVKDLEFGQQSQLVFEANGANEEQVKNIAKVLENRVTLFGATGVNSTVEGTKVTVTFTGVEDVETMRKYLTMKGEVSFRNSKDEKLTEADVLATENAFQTISDGEHIYLYLNVADTSEFLKFTTELAAKTDKMMVIWVDYDGTAKYETESKKTLDAPAYVAAATVSSGLDGSSYLQSAQDEKTTLNICRMVSGGKLVSEVKEVGYTVLENTNSRFNAVVSMSLVACLLVCAYIVYTNKAAGCIGTVMVIGYSVCYFALANLFKAVFNSSLLACWVLGLALAAGYETVIGNKIKMYIKMGRSNATAIENAHKESLSPMMNSYVMMLIFGVVVYLADAANHYSGAVAVIISAVLSIVFFALWQKPVMVSACSDLAKVSLGVKDDEVVNVEKGESYIQPEHKTDFVAKNTKVVNVAVIVVVALLAAVMASKTTGLLAICLAMVVCACLACAVDYIRYKNTFTFAGVALALVSGLAGVGIAGLTGVSAVVLAASTLAAGYVTISELVSQYSKLRSEKRSIYRINDLYNYVTNTTGLGAGVSSVVVGTVSGVVALVCGAANAVALVGVVLASVVGCYASVLLGSLLWHKSVVAKINAKPAKGKKTGSKEKEETTIFGINNAR